MKKLTVFLVILILAVLIACSGAPSAEVVPTPITTTNHIADQTPEPSSAPTPTPDPTPAPTPNLYMYEDAIEDFLLPLEDYSWARQYDPEYVMIHFTSGVVADPQDPYNLETIRSIFEDGHVSIHYIVDRDGAVYCYIPEDHAAWHAGKGTFANDEKYTNKMNYYAIGIEIVAIGSKNDMAQYLSPDEYDALDPDLIGFTDAQYEALHSLVDDICTRHNIPMDSEHVIGHEDFSPTKTDPGELFDWDRLFSGTATSPTATPAPVVTPTPVPVATPTHSQRV